MPNIPAGVRRTPCRRHFRNSPFEQEFNRTTINELQTQHSWLRSFSLFLRLLPVSLPPPLPPLFLSGELSRECHRDAPASRSVFLSFSVFFLAPVYRRLFLSLSFPVSRARASRARPRTYNGSCRKPTYLKYGRRVRHLPSVLEKCTIATPHPRLSQNFACSCIQVWLIFIKKNVLKLQKRIFSFHRRSRVSLCRFFCTYSNLRNLDVALCI